MPVADDSGSEQALLRLDGLPVAGVRGVGDALPRDRGPRWMTYFEVEDTDGGGPPGGRSSAAGCCGRRTRSKAGLAAEVADPEGAPFMLIEDGPLTAGGGAGPITRRAARPRGRSIAPAAVIRRRWWRRHSTS